MPPPPPTFALTERHDGRDLVLTATGELDLTSVPLLRTTLSGALARRPPRLLVDLSRVTFVQASALAAVVRGKREAEVQGTA